MEVNAGISHEEIIAADYIQHWSTGSIADSLLTDCMLPALWGHLLGHLGGE